MGCPVWRGSGQDYEDRVSAGANHHAVLWQRDSSRGRFALEHEIADFVSLSQVDQATGENDVGAKIENNRTRSAEIAILKYDQARPYLRAKLPPGLVGK